MDKRERVVELITKTLENDSLIHKQKVKMTINNIFYKKLKENKEWDKILEMILNP